MRSARRTVFASPLVAVAAAPLVVACGESARPTVGPGPGTAAAPRLRWMVNRDGARCIANEQLDCPPKVACNPPPPMIYTCPPDMPTQARVAQRADGTCLLEDLGTPIACPTPDPPTVDAGVTVDAGFTGRAWKTYRNGGRCFAAMPAACPPPQGGGPMPPCNPPPPIAVDCAHVGTTSGNIIETAPGECIAWPNPDCPPNTPCNPPPPRDVACPR